MLSSPWPGSQCGIGAAIVGQSRFPRGFVFLYTSCSSRLSLWIFGQLCATMPRILQAPPCVPNVLVMHSGFSTAFGKDRAAATMWMCGNPRLGRVYADGLRSFTTNFIGSIFFASESRRTDHPLCTSLGLSIVILEIP